MDAATDKDGKTSEREEKINFSYLAHSGDVIGDRVEKSGGGGGSGCASIDRVPYLFNDPLDILIDP